MKPLKNFWVVWILFLLSGSIFFGNAEGAITKLNGPLPADSLIIDWQASPNGGPVVNSTGPTHRAWKDALFSVTVSGGTAIRITPPLSDTETISSCQISPDSSRVVYLKNSYIFSAPIGGGAVITLNENISSQVHTFLITPDNQKIVYLAVVPILNQWGLYSVPLAGPASSSIRIDTNLGGQVDLGFKISPDSSRVVYRSQQDTAGTYEIYSIPLRLAGPVVKLNGPLATDGQTYEFAISPDGSRVIYRGGKEPGSDTNELYSIPIAGPAGTAIRIDQSLSGTGRNARRFMLSPNNQHVVFEVPYYLPGPNPFFCICRRWSAKEMI
jgi:Tol biopolymer transport system component